MSEPVGAPVLASASPAVTGDPSPGTAASSAASPAASSGPPAGMPDRRGDRRKTGRARWQGKLIGLGVSAVVLVLVMRKIDLGAATTVIAASDPTLVVLSCALILPIVYLTALRFLWIVPPGSLPGAFEALRLTLVANALNLLLPAKLGDFGKSFFLMKRGDVPVGVAVSAVVMERVYDLFGLLTLCLLGWLLGVARVDTVPTIVFVGLAGIWTLSVLMLSSERGATALCKGLARLLGKGRLSKLADIAAGWPELLRIMGRRRFLLALYSLGLWFLHLTQIWMFYVAVRADVPFVPALALSSLVLIAALLPFTFAGVGVRDAAFVFFFAAYAAPAISVAAATLCMSRVLIPPLAAVPFLISHGFLVAERRRSRLRYTRGADARDGAPGGPPSSTARADVPPSA